MRDENHGRGGMMTDDYGIAKSPLRVRRAISKSLSTCAVAAAVAVMALSK